MRVLAGAALDLGMERDLEALLPLQCEDGGWDVSWFYKLHGSGDKDWESWAYDGTGFECGGRIASTAAAREWAADELEGLQWDAPLAMVQTLSAQLQVTTVLSKLTATAVLVATLLGLVTARSGIR